MRSKRFGSPRVNRETRHARRNAAVLTILTTLSRENAQLVAFIALFDLTIPISQTNRYPSRIIYYNSFKLLCTLESSRDFLTQF